MFKEKHDSNSGISLKKKTRVIMSLLEIVSRNLVLPFMKRTMKETSTVFEKDEKENGKSGKIGWLKTIINIVNWLKGILSSYF